MYNYALKKEDSKIFIKCYKVKNGVIEIQLGSGEVYKEPYSEEKEKQLLAIEKAQVNISKMGPFIRRGLIGSLGTLGMMLLTALSPYSQEFFQMENIALNFLSGTVYGAGIIFFCSHFIDSVQTARDLKKNKLFLEIEEKINQYGKKDDLQENRVNNLLLGVDSDVRDLGIHYDGSYQLNINQIDALSLKDLKKLRANILSIEYFDQAFSNPVKKEKIHQKSR